MLLKDFARKYKDQTNISVICSALMFASKKVYGDDGMKPDNFVTGPMPEFSLEEDLTPEFLMLGMIETQDLLKGYFRAKQISSDVTAPFSLAGDR